MTNRGKISNRAKAVWLSMAIHTAIAMYIVKEHSGYQVDKELQNVPNLEDDMKNEIFPLIYMPGARDFLRKKGHENAVKHIKYL